MILNIKRIIACLNTCCYSKFTIKSDANVNNLILSINVMTNMTYMKHDEMKVKYRMSKGCDNKKGYNDKNVYMNVNPKRVIFIKFISLYSLKLRLYPKYP